MDPQRPILVLTVSAGAGHVVAAQALAAALEAAAPGRPVLQWDLMRRGRAPLRWCYAGGYDLMVERCPALMSALYERTNGRESRAAGWLRTRIQRLLAGRFLRDLQRLRPALIVHTHFLGAELVSHMLARGRIDSPQVTVITDFDVHPLWVQPGTTRYYVAGEHAAEHLRRLGVDGSRVRISGIPLRAEFEQPSARAAARQRLGLAPDRHVALLLCSGLRRAAMCEYAREFERLDPAIQRVLIAGRRPQRAAALRRLLGTASAARLEGFSDQMHVWLRAADVVVTKPGGLTVAEGLAAGAVLVFIHPIPGQEMRNSDILLEAGAALRVNDPRMLSVRIEGLLASAQRRLAMAEAGLRLARPGAAAEIAADCLALVSPASLPRPAAETRSAIITL